MPRSAAFLVMLLVLSFLPGAFGATISGTIYDLELAQVRDAVVTITTTPEQRIVAKDGTYSFTVPQGEYELAASAVIDGTDWEASENLTVREDGAYTVDLLLEPSFEGSDTIELEDPAIPSVTLDETQTRSSWPLVALLIVAVVALAAVVAWRLRRAPARVIERIERQDEFRDAVLDALKRHKGRATQKELRREVPFSEAKVSLVLTQLEAQGKVQRIKKGRGNVVVLK